MSPKRIQKQTVYTVYTVSREAIYTVYTVYIVYTVYTVTNHIPQMGGSGVWGLPHESEAKRY